MSHVQETSLEAFSKVQPKLAQRQMQILHFFDSHADRNWTNMEVAEGLGWSINRVTPRVLELREKGVLVLACKRACRVTGCWAMAWVKK